MRKITSLLMLFCLVASVAWAQAYRPGARTTTLEEGKKYFISAATFYKNARPNLLYNNGGNLAYSDVKPAGAIVANEAYLFTVEEVGDSVYIKNNEGKYLQATTLASTETKTGVKVVPYHTVKGGIACGDDVQACDENGNKIEYDAITDQTPIVCVYFNNETGWRHISDLQTGKSTAFAFYEVLEGLPAIEVTTNPEAPVYYTIKNVRGNAYAAYNGSKSSISLHPTVESSTHLFYFTAGESEGTYKIHNTVNNNLCADYNSWTETGIDWYIKQSGNTQYIGYAISKQAELKNDGSVNEAWNDFQNKQEQVAGYGGNDAGSVWEIEKYEGVAPGLQLSTEDNIVLHYIRSNRRTSYVNFEGHNVTFKEGNLGYGSYWYFVEDKTATDVPEGYVAVKIFNAAHATAVENYTSGYMEDSWWPAKTFYIGLRENNNCGYEIHLPGESNGWHDFGGTYIGSYGLSDDGSLWRIYPADKTVAQLKAEANTVKTNALAFVAVAEEADFYTYTDEAIATAKTTLEGVNVETLHGATSSLLNAVVNTVVDALKNSEKTVAPVAGQYIQLKNKAKNTYLKPSQKADGTWELRGSNDVQDKETFWLVEEGTDGNVKLKNYATGKYIGEIRQSAEVSMVDAENAKQFAFTNQVDCYGVFHETSGGDYAYGHFAGGGNLVGWEKNADASQWIILELSKANALAELQAAYTEAQNSVGVAVGMYKETDAYIAQKAIVEDAIANYEDKDVATLLGILEAFENVCASATEKLEMAPGYYFVKGTGNGNNANWYLTHKFNNNAECLWAQAPANLLNADYIWKFEGDNENGYKMQCVNLGAYFQMKIATNNGDNNTYVNKTAEEANVMKLTDNGSGKFSIKNTDSQNIRTENGDANGAQVNYWSSESNETWYLIPATELDINMVAAQGGAYTSIYLPFAVTLDEGTKAYAGEVSDAKDVLNMTEVGNVVPAETPVVLVSDNAGAHTLTIGGTADAVANNDLEGTLTPIVFDGNKADYLIFGIASEKAGFYTSAGTQISANKAYLPASLVAAAQTVKMNFGGEATGIEAIEKADNAKAPIYDLSGRRVVNTAKGGIYIQNGRKFIVK